MESSSIVIKVMSCRDLKAFNFFQKLSVYALVSISSEDPDKKLEQSQQQRTPTDGEGDGNPEWKHEMRFDLDEASFQDNDHLFIHFELHAEAVFGDKNIGEVRVPLKDLIDESNGIVRFVNYEVSASDGKSNGVLNFSYKVNAKSKGNEISAALPVSNIDGYSVVQHPSPEILYPTAQVESCYPSSEVQYPSLELSSPSHETYSGPEGDHYHSPEVQHTSHEAHYHSPEVQHISHEGHYPPPYDSYYPPPPPHDIYYPPGPPPPPPHDNYYPPGPPPPPHLLPPPLLHHHHHHQGRPPMMHRPFYHPHRPPPPPIHPWTFASGYDSSEYRH